MAARSDAIRAAVAQPRMRAAILVALGAGAFVLGLRLWLWAVGSFPGDGWALAQVGSRTFPRPVTDLGTFFSVIGTPVVATCTLLAVLPAVVRVDGLRGAAFLCLAGAGVLFNMGLKVLSGPTPMMRERFPELTDGLNYPSGHTVYGVVFFGALAWLAWRRRRLELVVPLAILIALMGPFRVIVEAHFVSDVLAGYAVGIGWLVPAAVLTGVAASRPPAPAERTPTPN